MLLCLQPPQLVPAALICAQLGHGFVQVQGEHRNDLRDFLMPLASEVLEMAASWRCQRSAVAVLWICTAFLFSVCLLSCCVMRPGLEALQFKYWMCAAGADVCKVLMRQHAAVLGVGMDCNASAALREAGLSLWWQCIKWCHLLLCCIQVPWHASLAVCKGCAHAAGEP